MLPLNCTVERIEGKAFLRISGEIDLATAAIFCHHLRDLVELEDTVVIDLRQVSYMDSTGIKALESAAKGRSNIVLILPAMLRRLAEITRFDLMVLIQEIGSPN